MRFLVLGILWVVTILVEGWLFWILFGISGVASYFIIGRWIYRNSSPWRRIYFPLVDRYSFLSGAHVAAADMAGEQFSPKKPLAVLLKEIQPAFTDDEISYLLEKWQHDFESFQNASLFGEIMRENGVSERELPVKVQALATAMAQGNNYNALFVRHAVGEIIESKVGSSQKKAYWRAVLSGRLP
jgi:hypothetical protein